MRTRTPREERGTPTFSDQRPRPRVPGARSSRTSKQQRQRRRDETAPQVVEDLPLREHRQRISQPALARTGHARQQPARELPVAANPAMPAARCPAAIGRRILFVAAARRSASPSARVAAFEQVVAQDPILGKAAAQRPLERVDVVDPLADEGVLRRTRPDRRRRRRACTDRCPGRPPCRRAYHERFAPGRLMLDARLQDAVALGHPCAVACLPRRRSARFSGCAITPTNCRADVARQAACRCRA